MEKTIVRPIDDKNRVVIPPGLLKQVELKQGDHVILKKVGTKIQIIKAIIKEG